MPLPNHRRRPHVATEGVNTPFEPIGVVRGLKKENYKNAWRCCHLLGEIKNKTLLLLCHLRACLLEEPGVH